MELCWPPLIRKEQAAPAPKAVQFIVIKEKAHEHAWMNMTFQFETDARHMPPSLEAVWHVPLFS